MPIIDYVKEFMYEIVTWDVNESSDELIDLLQLSPEKVARFESFPPKQGREFLGLYACLKALKVDANVHYTPQGKPYLNKQELISISHSYGLVSVAVGIRDIGLDIEKKRDKKILNIENKFVREDERAWIPRNKDLADYLHIIWGIKEALYKINGGSLWNFLHHYRVEPFELISNKRIKCWITSENSCKKYHAYFRRINSYYLIWVIDY